MNIKNLKYIDLTHTLSPTIPHWSVGCGFQYHIKTDYSDCTTETKFRVQSIEMLAGVGTHMDAPLHCIPGAMDIANIPLEQLIVPCVKVDVSVKAHESYCVSAEDIIDFENQYGSINPGSFVIIHTGWGQYWDEPSRYRNELIFPTISAEAVKCLLTRDIVGLGIDTLSPDNEAQGFPVHQLILGANKYIIENVAHSGLVPAVGAYTIALPLKIQGGTESAIRLIAMMVNSSV